MDLARAHLYLDSRYMLLLLELGCDFQKCEFSAYRTLGQSWATKIINRRLTLGFIYSSPVGASAFLVGRVSFLLDLLLLDLDSADRADSCKFRHILRFALRRQPQKCKLMYIKTGESFLPNSTVALKLGAVQWREVTGP